MSYDLFFPEPAISQEDFCGYFEKKKHYELNGKQAWYQNEDTGVYFSFEYPDEPEEEPEEPESPDKTPLFTMNLCRPHYFGLEAEPELRAFVERFGCAVSDFQVNGMEDGTYSTEGFLRGWNEANAFGYRAILSGKPDTETVHSRPAAELEAIWRWNLACETVQEALGDYTFVPKVCFVEIDGILQSVVVWTDAISTLIPQVDTVLVFRRELAPRRLFRRKDDICVVPFAAAPSLLEPFRSDKYALPAFLLPTTVPEAAADYVRSLTPHGGTRDAVSMDEVLDRELVEKCRSSK